MNNLKIKEMKEFYKYFNGDEIKLYHHKTDGGAEYLSDTYIVCPSGHKEGVVNGDTKVVIRLDGGANLFFK